MSTDGSRNKSQCGFVYPTVTANMIWCGTTRTDQFLDKRLMGHIQTVKVFIGIEGILGFIPKGVSTCVENSHQGPTHYPSDGGTHPSAQDQCCSCQIS